MSTSFYKSEQFLPVDLKSAWAFFSTPKHLPLLSPPELNFTILTYFHDKEIFEGMIIDYTLRPFLNLTFHWQTEIGKIERYKFFIDKQTKGPFKVWEHTHTFSEVDGGVLMQDEVMYKLPLGFLGQIYQYLFIRNKVKNLFAYRKQVLEKQFAKDAVANT